jgi:hypothetical protein
MFLSQSDRPSFTPIKVYRGVEVQLHSCLTSALHGGECLTIRPFRITPGKKTGTCWIRNWSRYSREENNFLPVPEFKPRTVQFVAMSSYRLSYSCRYSLTNKFRVAYCEVALPDTLFITILIKIITPRRRLLPPTPAPSLPPLATASRKTI